jgi:hypothetical protein
MTNGVCCAQNCDNDPKSEDCSGCGGPGSAHCTVVNSKACTSGEWPEVHCVTDDELWHYSRSTHFGLTSGDPSGRSIISEQAVKDWNPPAATDTALANFYKDFYYIDTGVQF